MKKDRSDESLVREVVKAAERVVGHILAIVVGLVLMVVGLGLGVTMLALPLGVPVGLVGLLVFIWGLAVWQKKQS